MWMTYPSSSTTPDDDTLWALAAEFQGALDFLIEERHYKCLGAFHSERCKAADKEKAR